MHILKSSKFHKRQQSVQKLTALFLIPVIIVVIEHPHRQYCSLERQWQVIMMDGSHSLTQDLI